MTQLKKQFQLSDETREDRFPKIFRTARRAFPKAKTILSFGCSRGLECFTLNKYFPKAEVMGYDISQYLVQMAVKERDRRKLGNVLFTTRLSGTYDIVFALMVFFSISDPIPREDFDKAVKQLASRVNPGGLIVFHNLEFEFIHKDFKAVRTWKHKNNRNPIDKTYFGGAYRRNKSFLFTLFKNKR